jgi:hypothetical protein
LLGRLPIRHQVIDMLLAPFLYERARPRWHVSNNKCSGTNFKFRIERAIAGMEMRRRVIVIINRYEDTIKPADDWHVSKVQTRRALREALVAAK